MGNESQTAHKDRQTSSPFKSGTTTDVMKNIYDLEGNYREWTCCAAGTIYRRNNGGDYDAVNSDLWLPASNQGAMSPNGTNKYVSSRITLYIK